MNKSYFTMTMEETQLFPRVGLGCKNLMPLLIYMYNNYKSSDVVKALNYLIKNNIVGQRLLEVLISDFNSDFDCLIKWSLKSVTERRYKL